MDSSPIAHVRCKKHHMARGAESLRLAAVALLSLSMACSRPASRASAPDPYPPPPPAAHPSPSKAPPPALQGPRYRHPEGAIAFHCLVFAEAEATIEEGGKAVRLAFWLTNRTGIDREVTLHGHCPRGFVEVEGLPNGFDPMLTCQRGACMQPEMKTTLRVPASGRVSLGETQLRVDGDACNSPLPTGHLALSISVRGETHGGLVCSGPAQHLENGGGWLRFATTMPVPAPTPQRLPAPEPSPPRPSPMRENCPACGIGCPGSRPLTGTGPDGCPLCGCEEPWPTITRQPSAR